MSQALVIFGLAILNAEELSLVVSEIRSHLREWPKHPLPYIWMELSLPPPSLSPWSVVTSACLYLDKVVCSPN